MSFGFTATDEAWPSRDKRIIRDVDLKEISVVQICPAYNGTSVQARAKAWETSARIRYVNALLAGYRS
jgi:phage head maturation protease